MVRIWDVMNRKGERWEDGRVREMGVEIRNTRTEIANMTWKAGKQTYRLCIITGVCDHENPRIMPRPFCLSPTRLVREHPLGAIMSQQTMGYPRHYHPLSAVYLTSMRNESPDAHGMCWRVSTVSASRIIAGDRPASSALETPTTCMSRPRTRTILRRVAAM